MCGEKNSENPVFHRGIEPMTFQILVACPNITELLRTLVLRSFVGCYNNSKFRCDILYSNFSCIAQRELMCDWGMQ